MYVRTRCLYIVASPCWGYGFVTQTWLGDDANGKLCRSNVTFISDRSTTAWLVARWHRVEILISGLNPPGRSLSQFWCDSAPLWHHWIVIYMFPSVTCAFLRAGSLGIQDLSSPLQNMIGFGDILVLLIWRDVTTHGDWEAKHLWEFIGIESSPS
jgi:hypothetical protein